MLNQNIKKSKLISFDNRKSFLIRPSGRSTDFISPSFGFGCLYNCHYCYLKRHTPNGLSVSKNIGDSLSAINNHAYFTDVSKPNQTHEKYTTYDLGCNEDFALHAKFYDWKYIFTFFKNHPKAFGSFATKYVNKKLLEYNPEKKIRIRFSLMPQVYSDLLEPNTSKIIDRIKAIDLFVEAGYDVHINFSPVIVYKNWLEEYKKLFILVNQNVKSKKDVKCEVIFLTHNLKKHFTNLEKNKEAEKLLWLPNHQEPKKSSYGGENIRYKHKLKQSFIHQWIQVHQQEIAWCKIRYIF